VLRRIALVGLAALLASCGGGTGELRVSAASSLTAAFTEFADAFEAANPGVEVVLNLSGSSTLREQILEGAPVDVCAAADSASIAAVAELTAAPPTAFATNRLQMAVPAGNPGNVTGLDDLARSDLLVGLCAEPVPCGALAERVLAAAGVTAQPDTRETSVRSLVTKLAAGELDVGLVYATDVLAEPGIAAIGDPLDPGTAYEIAVLSERESRAAAEEFVAFALSAEGQEILTRYGFGPP
jgi:molybdate transport system substrate-binding protein